jgi:hypothetical protein
MKEEYSNYNQLKLYSKDNALFKLLFLFFIGLLLTLIGCQEDNSVESINSNFKLASPDIKPDSLLPKEYTCDGESTTLPLEWSGFPKNTKSFALIMHHEASPTDIHWYWVLYNIPSSVLSLPKNVAGIGTLGNNSVNGKKEYAPPCSQVPGLKNIFIRFMRFPKMSTY